MEIYIRKADLNDIYTISKIYALSWKKAYIGMVSQKYLDELKEDFWVEVLEDWIKNSNFSIYLLCENEKPIGCISCGKSREEQFSDWGEIPSFYLLPQYFNKGYGKLLLEKALFSLKNEGYQNIYLWVLRENLRSRHFYEKNGFKWNKEELGFEIMGEKLIDYRYIYSF